MDLPVGFAKCQPQREFTVRAAEFAQSIAAHAGGHGLRDIGGSESERRGALTIDHDLDFFVTLARLGTHGFEPLDARHDACHFVGQHGEFFGGFTGELHAEALASHGVLVVPFEAGLADDDLGEAFLGLGDELLHAHAAFVARLQHHDRERLRLVVDGVEALDGEFLAPGFEVTFDHVDSRFHSLDGM